MNKENKGILASRAQSLAILIGALGTFITALSAHFRPEKEVTATAGYEELREKIVVLQTWVDENRIISEKAEESCKSEVDQVMRFVEGFLLGHSKTTIKEGRKNEKIDQLVKSLRRMPLPRVKRKEKRSLKKLKEPPQLKMLQQQSGL